jgi:Fe(3+) dicitrate transport protein
MNCTEQRGIALTHHEPGKASRRRQFSWRSGLRHGAALCAGIWLATGSASAQGARSSVAGRVIDVTGQAVVGASVSLHRPSAGVTRTATTDGEGRYEFHDVPAGPYSISAVLAGFSVARQELTIWHEALTVDLTLQPGSFVEEITVIGARLVGSEEVLRRIPGSVDVLPSDVLEASHVFTTGEALRKVPGVLVRDEEGLGLRPNIGIRGLNPTRSTKALLLEDGVPTTYAPYGDNASYYHPPIERFSRVEVLKGSGQIAYGPVTVGGVVNYITPDPPARRSTAVTVEGGNRDFLSGHVDFGGTWGGTGLLLDAMRKQSDGARENQRSELNDLSVKWLQQLSARQNLSVKANYYGEDSQVTYSGLRDDEYQANPRQNPFANDDFNGDRGGFSGTYRALLRDNIAFATTGYAQVFHRDWWRQSSNSGQRPNDAADPACGGMTNLNTTCGNEGRLRRYYLFGVEPRVRISYRAFGIGQETDAGLRFHVEDQDRRQENGATPTARSGVLVEDNHRTANAVSSFLQHRLLMDHWTVTPGIRVEHIAYARTNRLANAGAGVSGQTSLTEIIPGLGVAYAATPQTTVFAGLHRGFAPPRVEDVINNNTGGVVELDPERSWNTEIGLRTQVAQGLRVDGAFFQMDYENQIVPASLAGGVGATLTNGGETLHRGVEVGGAFDSDAVTGGAHDIYARVAFTWLPVARFTGVRFSSVPGNTTVSVSGNRLPYAAETLATVTLGYRHAVGVDVQLEAQHMGDQFGDDLNTIAGSVDGQRGLIPALTLWNTAATWRINNRSSLFVAIKNLANRTAIVDRTRGILPTHPRLIQVGTSLRF